MDDQGGDAVSVWRIGGPALVVGYAIPTVVGVSALTSWAGWVSSPGVDAARTAGLWTGLTVGIALFLWWAVLRVRLEVGPAGIVAVNPWGTHRLAPNEVASVRLGAWGAEFRHGDGFKTTAYALSEMAAGTSQDQRLAELLAVLQSNPDFAPRA